MSYTVFALKWRPQNFDEIIGQPHIVTTLKSALQKNRLAHAYLFAGPRGVGKTSAARILAKSLNCKEGPTVTPCQKCPACLEISQSHSFDVIEIDGASNRGIDEIRALRESVKFAPTQGKFKVYIIDEVHQITSDGFNALLKTLEEPPPFVKFIFATTHPHKVPPTILSRCQKLDFRRISLMEIIAQLERIAAREKITVEKEVLFAIARSSDGSLRDAESLLDQMVSFSQEKISLKDVISVLGLVEQDALFEIIERIIAKDALSVLKLLNTIIDEGKDTGVFLANLIEHFRNLMVAKIAQADYKLIDLPQDICARLLKQSQSFSLEEIFSAFNLLVNTQEMSKRLESLRIPLEISLVKLAHDKKGPDFVRPPVRPPVQEVKKEDAAPPDPPAEPANQVSLEDIKNIWNEAVENLGKIKMSVATYLNEGSPIKLENNILTVAFPKDYSLHKECLETRDNKTMIEKALAQILNSNLRVNFILSREAAHKDVEEDSFLRSALEIFKGKVIKKE
ncbi:MAG: DNA polymerase III subunit gamma/tau [Candidatus Omnitrophota bacterium]|jgi:DNA polymerase-3 subunit gamma/tau